MSPTKAAHNDILLPSQSEMRIQQATGKVTANTFNSREHLIVVLPARVSPKLWKQLPEGSRLQALMRKRKTGDGILHARLHNQAATGISLQKLPDSDKGSSCPAQFDLLSFAGALAADALRDNPASLDIMVCGFGPGHAAKIVKALVLALAAHRFAMPSYKSGKKATKRLKALRIVGMDEPVDVSRAVVEAAATNLARWLTSLPPNKLDTATYRSILQKLSKDHGWRYEFWDEKRLKSEGAGAFLAVSQGNSNRDAGIAHIRYIPKGGGQKSKNPAISLVGKGIIFDTGGTNLKPFKAMLDMHQDMAGSAVALATLIALTQLEHSTPVDCWLAITENRLSAEAYKPRDIVTAINGTTIEVIHTDAEGRMALADTLALAGRESPRIMLDFATLTGTCVSALTERYSGAFTNHEHLHPAIIAAGKDSGERVWPFPLDKDFDDEIKSEVADVLQCAAAGGGDHIQAARFLKRFVPDQVEWVHIDLSAASRKGGLAQIPGEITGFGVRFALNLLLDQPGIAGTPTTGNTTA